MTNTRYVTQAETNKMIRAALRDAFPGVAFSVRGSGGNATNVTWTDGPAEKTVEEIARRFEGISFDGMPDLASPIYDLIDGERVHYGCSYIFTRRTYSAEITEAAQNELAEEGVDPHGHNTQGTIPDSLAVRFEEINRLIWNGYGADGALLTRVICAALADERWNATVTA